MQTMQFWVRNNTGTAQRILSMFDRRGVGVRNFQLEENGEGNALVRVEFSGNAELLTALTRQSEKMLDYLKKGENTWESTMTTMPMRARFLEKPSPS